MPASFTDRVYQLVSQIPPGKVATYGQIAALAGSPGAARAVGMAMRTNPNAPRVPCHRVVAVDGRLTGYSADGGIVRKKELLQEEGVVCIGDRVDLRVSKATDDYFTSKSYA